MTGEFELIARLRERLEAAAPEGARGRVVIGSGDDAAVTIPAGASVTSVDIAIDGIHFRRAWAPSRSIGHKALAAALSDLAAMGAEASEAYVQLGVPEDLDAAGCLELADGMAALAARCAVVVIGGDVSRAPALTLAVTAVGRLGDAADAVTRGGAHPGDALVVTGELGGAAAGLLLLERPELERALQPRVAAALRARQLEPLPRLSAGRVLAEHGASAMIDLSDGLGADAAHLAAAGGVGLDIELERLPLSAGVGEVAAAAGTDPLDLAAGGGEDYELLAALPPERVEAARGALRGRGLGLTEVGRVTGGGAVRLRDPAGEEREPAGFDQLRPPR